MKNETKLLVGILVISALLRLYHIDRPVNGFHCWKESYFLSISRNYLDGGNPLYPRTDYMDLRFELAQDGMRRDVFPLPNWIITALWFVFGVEAWMARLVIVAFSVAGVFFFYLLCRELFGSEHHALLGVLVFGMLPLLVYFGQNAQADSVALCFTLASFCFFARWLGSGGRKQLYLSTALMSLSMLVKYPYLLNAVAMLLMIPKEKRTAGNLKVLLLCFIPLALWLAFNFAFIPGTQADNIFTRIDLTLLPTVAYWEHIVRYAMDNFTIPFLLLGILGAFFLARNRQEEKNLMRFLLAGGCTVIMHVLIFTRYFYGHSYYQMTFSPFVAIAIVCGLKAMRRIRLDSPIVVFLIFLFFGMPSITEHFREYQPSIIELAEVVRNNTQPDERIFFTTNPAILWHSERKGYFGPYGMDNLRFGEENRSIHLLVMYLCDTELTARFDSDWSDAWEYINENYEVIYAGSDCNSTVWVRRGSEE